MNKKQFIESLKKLNIEVTNEVLEKLEIYKNFLQEYNKHTNLTRIISDEDIYLKHFYDSLTILKALDLNDVNNLLDIGTGAGFPGMVLKIFFPNIHVTLLDSNNKKTKFLEEITQKLNLDVEIVNQRVEDYAKDNLNKFDVVTSRAVANMRVLTELSLPLVNFKGVFVAYKGSNLDELEDAKDTIEIMHGKILRIITFILYDYDNVERNIIVIRKYEDTKLKDLRPYNKILHKPLAKNA